MTAAKEILVGWDCDGGDLGGARGGRRRGLATTATKEISVGWMTMGFGDDCDGGDLARVGRRRGWTMGLGTCDGGLANSELRRVRWWGWALATEVRPAASSDTSNSGVGQLRQTVELLVVMGLIKLF